MRTPLCLASLLLAVSVTAPNLVNAEQLMKLPPEMMLVRGTSDMGEVSTNVSVQRIDANRLPEAVIEQVKAHVMSYLGDFKQAGSVTAYVWSSPYFEAKKVPPNYIIDYSTLPAVSKDLGNPACDEAGCELVGYTYVDKNGWKQDFETTSLRTTFTKMADPSGGDNFTVVIDTLSNKNDCAEDGRATKKGCVRRFTWRKFGLAVLPPDQS